MSPSSALDCRRTLRVLCTAFVAALLGPAVWAGEQDRSLLFTTDVVPVLTKLGCNSGGCHGKATGQNGFKLSLLGFEPAADHQSIVKAARGRRVAVAAPAQSLLLLKATNQTPHGGGRRTAVGSDEYELLRRWVASGAPPPTPHDPFVERIEVAPAEAAFNGRSNLPLRVTARLSDGSIRDVTWRAVYESNQAEVAEVDSVGVVATLGRPGRFSIMVRFGGKVATFHGTVPRPLREGGEGAARLAQLEEQLDSPVDRQLLRQWRRLGIVPSQVADDATFLRRASLDICGTLPTREEAESYAADRREDKRQRLINRLLQRPEYASYFTIKWGDILQNRGRGYSTKRQRAGTAAFAGWIRDSLETNKPYDRFVSEILTASGSQRDNPPAFWYRQVRTQQDFVESTAQAFLGVRVQCAQCHHHPFDRWSQADYFALAAVFARVGRKGGFADAEVPTDEVIYLKADGVVRHPRSGRLLRPKPLGGPEFQLSRYDDPRRRLAEWMTSADNSFFARAAVNRMWAHFLGRGIFDPIDDARSSNPPTNPDLLDLLAEQFVADGYDLKQLIRVICNSHAYRLEAAPNRWNRGDRQTYARFYPRRLSAEVLLDAISHALDSPTKFPGGLGEFPAGTRAIELPDENVPASFLDVFGRPARTSACECERVGDPSLAQALTLINSPAIQQKLTDKDGYATRLAANQKPHTENVADVFLRVLGRPPRATERQAAVEFLESESDRAEAYRSLLWSLLATNEFLFNH